MHREKMRKVMRNQMVVGSGGGERGIEREAYTLQAYSWRKCPLHQTGHLHHPTHHQHWEPGCVCVCVCVCGGGCGRERESEREGDTYFK